MIKFIHYLNEAVQKNEINRALRDPNFQVGIEFEFIVRETISKFDAFSYVKEKLRKYGLRGEVKEDITIKPEFKEYGVEIATPVMSLQEALIKIPKYFDLIDEIGYTNDSTGLHINISHKNIDYSKIDPKKIASSLEDERIYKTMPSRKDGYNFSTEMRYRNLGDFSFEKQQTANFLRLDDNEYLEFRGVGGKDYHHKWDEIRKILLNYVVKYYLAGTDPNFQKRKNQLIDISAKEKRSKVLQQLIEKREFFKLIVNYFKFIPEWYSPSLWSDPDLNKKLINNIICNRDINNFYDVLKHIFSFSENENLLYDLLLTIKNFKTEIRDSIYVHIFKPEIMSRFDRKKIDRFLK